MLGLQAHSISGEVRDLAREITVAPYNPQWPEEYEKEKALLTSILGGLICDIHHFGSTSVPGLRAKPTIDIMIVVEDIGEVDQHDQAMESKGYSVHGENGIPGRRYFVRLDHTGSHTRHIHIYQRGNPHIEGELAFRDYLRLNKEACREYEQVKIEAAAKYLHNPAAYVQAKTDFVLRLTQEALTFFRRQ